MKTLLAILFIFGVAIPASAISSWSWFWAKGVSCKSEANKKNYKCKYVYKDHRVFIRCPNAKIKSYPEATMHHRYVSNNGKFHFTISKTIFPFVRGNYRCQF